MVNDMGHMCSILTFKATTSKNAIQSECDDWGNNNCDPYERGGFGGGLGFNVKFTNKVFDSFEEAEEYLEGTFGNYKQTAVQYKKYSKTTESVKLKTLVAKKDKYNALLTELNKPHYVSVKSATTKCKECGSTLANKYCGKSWFNNCPICRAELRPQNILDKVAKYKATIKEVEKEIKDENKKAQAKAKYTMYWAVACEVHC